MSKYEATLETKQRLKLVLPWIETCNCPNDTVISLLNDKFAGCIMDSLIDGDIISDIPIIEDGFEQFSEHIEDGDEVEFSILVKILVTGIHEHYDGCRTYSNGDPGEPDEDYWHPISGWITDYNSDLLISEISMTNMSNYIDLSKIHLSIEDYDEYEDGEITDLYELV